MNPGVNFGAELPQTTNLHLNGSATLGSPVVHVAKSTQTILQCRGCSFPCTFTGRRADQQPCLHRQR
jgi:hypothetical protein